MRILVLAADGYVGGPRGYSCHAGATRSASSTAWCAVTTTWRLASTRLCP